jgi:hypothetical protein
VKLQRSKGRISAREAEGIFDLHVVEAWPAVAQSAASDLSQEQVVHMLRRLVEQGKSRTSNKLRTYLRAAYQCAINVRVSASIPVAFKAYGMARPCRLAAQVVGDAIEGFQLKRVRSGVETLLAANRISREMRGHVQSHGLTGIQARHYDGHDYMVEKREALELLARELCRSPARSKAAKPRAKAASAKPRAPR